MSNVRIHVGAYGEATAADIQMTDVFPFCPIHGQMISRPVPPTDNQALSFCSQCGNRIELRPITRMVIATLDDILPFSIYGERLSQLYDTSHGQGDNKIRFVANDHEGNILTSHILSAVDANAIEFDQETATRMIEAFKAHYELELGVLQRTCRTLSIKYGFISERW